MNNSVPLEQGGDAIAVMLITERHAAGSGILRHPLKHCGVFRFVRAQVSKQTSLLSADPESFARVRLSSISPATTEPSYDASKVLARF